MEYIKTHRYFIDISIRYVQATMNGAIVNYTVCPQCADGQITAGEKWLFSFGGQESNSRSWARRLYDYFAFRN